MHVKFFHAWNVCVIVYWMLFLVLWKARKCYLLQFFLPVFLWFLIKSLKRIFIWKFPNSNNSFLSLGYWIFGAVTLLHTEKYFELLLNQTEIRLYLPFSDWFKTKQASVWFEINRKMVNKIWFQFDLIRFRKDFSVCVLVGMLSPKMPCFVIFFIQGYVKF